MYDSQSSMPPLISYHSQADSIKSEISYALHANSAPDLQEYENSTDREIEELLHTLEDQRLELQQQVKALRSQAKHSNSNQIERDLRSLTERLFLTQKLIALYKDKVKLRTFIEKQALVIRNLGKQVLELEGLMKEELSKIQVFSNMHSTQREIECQKELSRITELLEQERHRRMQLQDSLELNGQQVEKLFADAEASKSIIVEQLRQIKQKMESLETQKQIFEDQKRQWEDMFRKQLLHIEREREFAGEGYNLAQSKSSVTMFNISDTLKRQQQLQQSRYSNRIFD